MMKNILNWIQLNLEWIILLTGLLLLAIMDPASQGRSLCFLDFIGIYCPGEGLGRSISYIFRGMWTEAWLKHPAGYLAIPVLTWRIMFIFFIKNKF